MDKLPREVFIQIVSNLSFRDRLENSLVCKRWHKLISNTVLYQKLLFSNSSSNVTGTVPTAFDKAFCFFRENQDLGNHTTSLILDQSFTLDLFHWISLPLLFPNVQSLTILPSFNQDEDPASININIKQELRKWKKLEQIQTEDLKMLFFLFEACPSFKHLNQLELNLPNVRPKLEWDQFYGYFQQNRLSSLKSLKLVTPIISISHMEMLHECAPFLESITLDSFEFDKDTDRSMFDLSPDGKDLLRGDGSKVVQSKTSGVFKHFKMTRGLVGNDTTDIMRKWFIYASQKYDNLHTFHFSNLTVHSVPIELCQAASLAISAMPKLIDLDINPVPLSQEIVDILEANRLKLRKVAMQHKSTESFIESCKALTNTRQQLASVEKLVFFSEFSFINSMEERLSIVDTLKAFNKILNNLTYLEFLDCGVNCDMLVTLVQEPPPKLKTLKINVFSPKKGTAIEKFSVKAIPASPIKDLTVDISSISFFNATETINHVFRLVFAACPNLQKAYFLEKFNLNNGTGLCLDATNLKKLEELELNFPSVNHFMLEDYSNINGRSMWKDEKTPVREDTNTASTERTYHGAVLTLLLHGHPKLKLRGSPIA